MRHTLLFVSVLAASGCFNDEEPAGGSEDSTGTTGADSMTPSSSPTATSAASNATVSTTRNDTDPSDTTDASESSNESASTGIDSTGANMDSSSSGDGATTKPDTEETGPMTDGDYRAVAIPGGLDRIRVMKRSDSAGTCTFVTLVTPSNGAPFDVTVTNPWVIESIAINDVPESCASDNPFESGGEYAVAATGTIDHADAMGAFPCTVDIAIDIDFDPMLLPVPESDVMNAMDIAVSGC
jgi:hypothetical protein